MVVCLFVCIYFKINIKHTQTEYIYNHVHQNRDTEDGPMSVILLKYHWSSLGSLIVKVVVVAIVVVVVVIL